MKTFNQIINKVINIDNNIFSFNYDNTDKINGIHKIFFNSLYHNQETKIYKNKFDFYIQTIENFYLSCKPIEREEFINLFHKIQRIYHILNRFCYLIKYNKSKLIVNNDLQLNIISENSENVICIYHYDSRYLFRIDELLKIIFTSLTNCYSFFSEPISIKNPYNNIPFGKSILYFIYFNLILNTKIKFIKTEYLDIFFKFVECNFNMTKVINSYEYILREYAIKNFINNSTKETIKDQIKSMIYSFNLNARRENKKINIDNEFPDNELIRIMKPYLYLKLQSNFSLVKKNMVEANNRLKKKLQEFQQFNPIFGRKIHKIKTIIVNGKTKRIKSHFEFNMKHKKFNTFEIETFMNNHLSYKYDGYGYEENNDDYYGDTRLTGFNFMTTLLLTSNDSNQTLSNVTQNNYDNNIVYEDEDDEDEDDEDDDDEDYEDDEDEDEFEDEFEDEDSIS